MPKNQTKPNLFYIFSHLITFLFFPLFLLFPLSLSLFLSWCHFYLLTLSFVSSLWSFLLFSYFSLFHDVCFCRFLPFSHFSFIFCLCFDIVFSLLFDHFSLFPPLFLLVSHFFLSFFSVVYLSFHHFSLCLDTSFFHSLSYLIAFLFFSPLFLLLPLTLFECCVSSLS